MNYGRSLFPTKHSFLSFPTFDHPSAVTSEFLYPSVIAMIMNLMLNKNFLYIITGEETMKKNLDASDEFF